jgi:DNA modification methylase
MVPFLGSGNTLLAAAREGMHGHGYDLSKTYKENFLIRAAKEQIKQHEQKGQ